MKIDLSDVTFLIPMRIDSIIRLENLLLTTEFLRRYFDCHIMVLEADVYNNGIIKKILSKKIEYYFIEDCDSTFYRTKYLNMMTEKVETPFLCILDADVIVPVAQITEAINKLRTGQYDVVLPYDGRALDVSTPIRELFMQDRNIKMLQKQQNKMKPLHQSPTLRGGAVFVNVAAYKNAGMENTSFYGWGSEDFDRYEKWMILGYRIYIVPGVLFHLTHPRGENSRFSHKNQLIISEMTLFKTGVSSAEDIQR